METDTEQLIINGSRDSGSSENEVPGVQVSTKRGFRITIEPVLGAVFLAQCLSDSVLTELYLKRTCQVVLQLNKSMCDALGSNTTEGHAAENIVQPEAAVYLMWKMVLQSVVPAALSVFLGPWTDKHGRKPVIVASVAGCSLMYATYVVLAYIPNIHPSYILLGIIPLSFLGGYVNMISASYCYISDVSTPETRSFRLGILEGLLFGGLLIGLSTSSYIFAGAEAYGLGYFAIFGLSGIICFLGLLYMMFIVPESVNVTEGPKGLRGILDLSLPMEMARTCLKPREGGRRAVVFLCILALASCILTLEGESQVVFLFTRLQFGWSLQNYTVFSSVVMVITIVGTLVGCWLLPKYLHVSDTHLSLFAFSSDIAQCVLIAIASPAQAYFLYIGGLVGALRGVVGPAIRSILSKTVPPQDLGKVFALTSSVESVMPIAASPLYVLVYDSTIHICPGAFFLLSAGFYALDVLLLGVIAVIQRKHQHGAVNSEPSLTISD